VEFFLLRDAMLARYNDVVVCLSVRLSLAHKPVSLNVMITQTSLEV